MRMIAQMTRLSLQATRVAGCMGLLMLMSGCCCTNGWLMNNSGMGYYKKGNYSMARHEFQCAVIDVPKNADYRHNLAMAMQKQGDTPQAEQVLRHNLSVNPMHQPTYHALAQLLVSQQRTAEADQLLTGWRESQPYVPEAYVEQAWLQRETGNRMAAEQTLRQALQVKPNHPAALAQLGQLYQENGQSDQAAAFYQRSLASRWNQPEVHSRLSTLTGTSSTAGLPRSAFLQNDSNIQMVSMNQGQMDPSQGMVVGGAMPTGEAMVMEDPAQHQRRFQRRPRGSSTQQMTAYPLPNYGLADAGPWQGGMMTASTSPGFPMTTAMSPTYLPEMTAAQPTFAPPMIGSTPTVIQQADPAHSTEMTAGLPVVDPH